MDPSKIGGPNFFPDKFNPLAKPELKKQAGNKEGTNLISSSQESELSGLFKLPPHKVVSKLSQLLEKSFKDPQIQQVLNQLKIPPNSRQALAFCAFSCLKELLSKKFPISAEEEKEILKAITEEFEEDSLEDIDPDEQKRRKSERKKQRRERRKNSSKTINAMLTLVEESIKTLEKNKGGFSFQT
ncbi:MAG: hypothetical protein QNJ31_04590 [Candidatus Caenarcaniphilales bacterium]|nr:hypothetical protein [Candidatus Caenarcaniphilales bacterium]